MRAALPRVRRLVAMLLLAGCGYRFVVPDAPEGVASVAVPVFRNDTTEPQVDALCTQALRERYHRAGVLGGADAEASLEGVVVAAGAAPFLASPQRAASPTYRLTAQVRLTLKRGGATLRTVTVDGAEEYPSGADILLTEANRARALGRLCEAMMRDAAARLAGR